MASFKYVYVPADTTEEIQECCLEIPEGKEVECLLDHLKKHFSSIGMTDVQRTARKKALLEQLGDKAQSVDLNMLDMAAGMQLVENVCLLANSRDCGYVGVNMYVDDQAQAKQLPFNVRASGLAEACGKMINICGDAFVARIYDDDDKFERRDFLLSEVSSSAPWVKAAREQVAKRDASDPQAFMEQVNAGKFNQSSKPGALQAAPKGPGEAAKERGNAAFKKGDNDTAVKEYIAALEAQPDLIAARSNRALVYLKLGQHQEALQDCEAVLQVEPANVKVLLRKAAALVELGQAGVAAEQYRRVLDLEPKNKEAQDAVARLQAGCTTESS